MLEHIIDSFSLEKNPRMKNWFPLFAVIAGLVFLATLLGFPAEIASIIYFWWFFIFAWFMLFFGPTKIVRRLIGMATGLFGASLTTCCIGIMAYLDGYDFMSSEGEALRWVFVPTVWLLVMSALTLVVLAFADEFDKREESDGPLIWLPCHPD